MIRLIFIGLFCLSFSFGQAQDPVPFPTSNAQWIMGKYFFLHGPPYSYNNSYFTTDGDTIINNIQYTIISKGAPYCFIREENRKVYCKYAEPNDTTEFVLYDFTLEVGDTISLPTYWGFLSNYHTSTINFVDSVLVGNKYHKRIHINSWISVTFIEGIGAEQGLMYLEIPWVDWGGKLMCFSKNDTTFFIGSSSTYASRCFYPTNIKIPDEADPISVYPNPTIGSLNISTDQIDRIELYNTFGQRIKTFYSPKFSIHDLPEGIYFLLIYKYGQDRPHHFKIFKSDG